MSSEWDYKTKAWLLLFAGLVIRAVLSPGFLLAPDETNYWQWSRHLALGYHDHPPLIAWSIALSTHLFGQTEFAVRLPTLLGITLAIAYIGLLAARWFSSKCGFHAVLLAQGLLLFNGAALIATPDGLLVMCWAGACYHAARALEDNSFGHWLAVGFWFGLGMLSKYTMGIFLPCLFFCMIHVREFRVRFAGVGPWVGLLLSTLIFSPVLFWNYQNEWVTFRHVLHQGGVDRDQLFTLHYVGDFLLTQILLLSPFVFCLIVVAWCGGGRKIPRIDRLYLVWMSMPTFFLFSFFSLRTRVYGNWPAAGYVTAIVMIAALFAPTISNNIRSSRFWKFSIFIAYVITVPVLIQTIRPVVPIPVELDRVSMETSGWDELAKKVQTTLDNMPNNPNGKPFIAGLTYQYASELAFYMKGQPETFSINRWSRPNVYDFWQDEQELLGRDAVGVFEWKGMENYLREIFERVDTAEVCTIYRDSPWFGQEKMMTHYVFRAYGFKGGLRWKPANGSDIRATHLQTDR